jgi:sulfur carrier protein
MPEITIRVGGRPHPVPAGSSLADLIAALGHLPNAVATGLNGDFVGREKRASTPLCAGDEVLVFQAIVGG